MSTDCSKHYVEFIERENKDESDEPTDIPDYFTNVYGCRECGMRYRRYWTGEESDLYYVDAGWRQARFA